MARKKAGKRGAAIIVLVVLAVLAGGPSAAMAEPSQSEAPANANAPSDAPAWIYAPGLEASWAE